MRVPSRAASPKAPHRDAVVGDEEDELTSSTAPMPLSFSGRWRDLAHVTQGEGPSGCRRSPRLGPADSVQAAKSAYPSQARKGATNLFAAPSTGLNVGKQRCRPPCRPSLLFPTEIVAACTEERARSPSCTNPFWATKRRRSPVLPACVPSVSQISPSGPARTELRPILTPSDNATCSPRPARCRRGSVARPPRRPANTSVWAGKRNPSSSSAHPPDRLDGHRRCLPAGIRRSPRALASCFVPPVT